MPEIGTWGEIAKYRAANYKIRALETRAFGDHPTLCCAL
jgi:hypothetical protein